MVVEISNYASLNWARSAQSDNESTTCGRAFEEVLRFLLSMESVAETYASKKRQNALRDAVALIVLNIIDGYIIDRPLLLSRWSAPDTAFADWDKLSAVANALDATNHCTLSNLNTDGNELLLTVAGPLAEQAPKLKAAILDHSQPIDVHRWSEHPESNAFVDAC